MSPWFPRYRALINLVTLTHYFFQCIGQIHLAPVPPAVYRNHIAKRGCSESFENSKEIRRIVLGVVHFAAEPWVEIFEVI